MVIKKLFSELLTIFGYTQEWFLCFRNSKNMPDSVRQEFKKVIMKESGRTEDQADEYLSELEQRKRYQLETWS